MTVATAVDFVSPHICSRIWTDCPAAPLASLPASVDLAPYTTVFGVALRLETSDGDTVIVPRNAFFLLAGSENLNLPTLGKVQFALCPAGIASGGVALQFIPVVGLNLTVWATMSVFLKITSSPTTIGTALGW